MSYKPLITPVFMVSLTCLLLVMGMMLLAGVLGLDPNAIDADAALQAPGALHWFGTDELGRDLLARLGVGAQISICIGVATALVAVCIGTAYGTIAALFEGHWLDDLMMRGIEMIYSLPGLMIVILFTLFFGRSMLSLVLALSLFSWPDTARIIRGQVLTLKREEYVEAFHSLGGNTLRLVWQHFLPNLTGILILTVTMTVPRAILTESTLSFVGLGVAPPLSSWGTMISDGWQMIRLAPHLLVLPGILLFITMVSLNVLGDCLEQYLNPRRSATA